MIAVGQNPNPTATRDRSIELSNAENKGISVENFSRRTVIIGSSLVASIASTGRTARAAGQPSAAAHKSKSKKIGIVLFPGFETLDVFGPVQMWGRLPAHEVVMISERGGAVQSAQGIDTGTSYSFKAAPQVEILMIPGGEGTRTEVDNRVMLGFLRKQNLRTEWTTSVCTGAALLAKAGILDSHKATTNKRAYQWATSQSDNVQWQASARWVVDGKFLTSSGISAGTDMALALVEKLYGRAQADQTARDAEYVWNDDPHHDPFAV